MSASLIRSRAMVTHAIDRHRWNEITDGAVLQEDGAIVEIGTYRDLSRRHPNIAVIGSGKEVMLPGFVNGHHHIGLTPVQLGSPDMSLELWFVTRMVMRNVNLYLDTLYSAFEMVASGVTTVQHLHGRIPGKLDQVDRGCDEAIRAYQDVGIRVSYSYAVRDQNRLVYQRDEDFIASLPSELRGPMQRWFERFQLTLDDDDESEERDRIARTVAAIKAVTGTRPVGWHTRSPGSVNTRRLLVEEGGFLYDSDAYNDDLPYFVQVGDKRHLVLPYAFDTNDMQFFHTNRFSGAADFAAYAIDAFDWLHREGAHAPKMMSIGLHLRIIGRPGRIGALDRILRHITNRGDAWIARRVDIANHWLAQFP